MLRVTFSHAWAIGRQFGRHGASTRYLCSGNVLNYPLKHKIQSNVPDWMYSCIQLARYDKPTGTWLLYIPCTWSIGLAAPPGHIPDIEMLALFGLGAILMRGAGCTINDLWDQNFDKFVERTKTRPLASGAISNVNALFFLGAQLSASLCVLLQLNWYSVGLGFAAMVPVITYPLFKRITYWPQVVLGITFNWGALLGYSAVIGHIDPLVCLPLYLAGINWTLVYDTLYAHQDIEDDLRIGIKSTAILFGEKTKHYLSIFHAGMTASFLTLGANIGASWIYYAGCSITMSHLAYLIYKTDLKNSDSCLSMFKANKVTGLMFFTTIVLEKLFTL